MASGLRERNRQAALRSINDAAMRLFLEQGFSETTTEQIAHAAGMSLRSLYRYVETKEDVVLGDLLETGHKVLEALRRRPPRESPWKAMQYALAVIGEGPDYDPRNAYKYAEMVLHTPSLRARAWEKRRYWIDLLSPALDERMGGGHYPQARAIVACALACLDTATEIWVEGGGAGDPHRVLRDVFDNMRASLTLPLTSAN
jgi:AcrR family transcriptional regulator